MLRRQHDAVDRRLLVLDIRLAVDHRTVDQLGVEADIRHRRREHPAPDVEHVGRLDHRLLEAAGDLRQRRDEEVAQGVAVELRAGFAEAVLKQPGDERFVVGQRDETVPNIAGRGDVVVAANPARAAAVVGDGDDRRDRDVVPLQTAQQGCKSSAAADGDDVEL